jgi:predicted enzyme related to lactoylglutathione lyase
MLRRIGNTHYWTKNMDAAVLFYRDVLGLDLTVRAGEDWAEFDVGGTTLALHGARPGVTPPQPGATVVFEVEDLDQVVRVLRLRGVDFAGDSGETAVGRFATLRDPDGNLLQIFEREG